MKNPIFWLALVAGNLAAAWIIVIWRYTIVGRVWKLATSSLSSRSSCPFINRPVSVEAPIR
jgi:hypothetical protein